MIKRHFEHGVSTTVQTKKGLLRGFRFDSIYNFYGVDYATAKRFQKPEEISPWEGVKEAVTYGAVAPQMFSDVPDNDLTMPHRFWPQSEQCQNLNIWTPSLDVTARKPVVVWFHGGGFFGGSSIEQVSYDGQNMSKYGDVVVVTVNHRLNVLGYLDLRKYGERYKHAANVGNLDLIAALHWVKNNIAVFGGNPDNITVFGQSGGGGKITSLMNMPSAEGLFHRALIMSGTLGEELSGSGIDLSDHVEKVLELLGEEKSGVEKLESIDYRELIDVYVQADLELGGNGYPFFGPLVNEDYLGDPAMNGFSEFAKNVSVMIGSTFAEVFTLSEKYNRLTMKDYEMRKAVSEYFAGRDTEEVIQQFVSAFPDKKLIDILVYDYGSFRYSSKEWVKKYIKEGGVKAYLYLFTPEMGVNESSMPWHCADIPYFFIRAVPISAMPPYR